MRIAAFRFARLALVAGALHACAVPVKAPTAPAVARPFVSSFGLEGRLSATDGEQAANGSLHWTHSPERDEWTVTTPLGQIAAQLVADGGGAVLTTADGEVYESEDVQSMLTRLFGVPAPVDGLPHWVQASARAGARVLQLDAAGRPARISDEGWIIDYLEYRNDTPASPPRLIAAHWGDARLRLVIDAWNPLP